MTVVLLCAMMCSCAAVTFAANSEPSSRSAKPTQDEKEPAPVAKLIRTEGRIAVRVFIGPRSAGQPRAVLTKIEPPGINVQIETTTSRWPTGPVELQVASPEMDLTKYNTVLDLTVADASALSNKALRYEVVVTDFEVVFSDTRATSQKRAYNIPVGSGLTATLTKKAIATDACRDLILDMEFPEGYNWAAFRAWLLRVNQIAKTSEAVTLRYQPPGKPPVVIPVRELRIVREPVLNVVKICVNYEDDLPKGQPLVLNLGLRDDLFQIPEFDPTAFNADPFRKGFKGSIKLDSGPAFGLDKDPDFKNNLEVGGSYTTSVAPNDKGVRVRKDEALLDFRLVPAPILRGEYSPDGWNWIYRPLKLDMSIANGAISRKSLSKNTITFGGDFEWWRAGSKNSTTIFRIVPGYRIAADRDLKKIEYGGSFRLKINPGFEKPLVVDRQFGYLMEIIPAGIDLGYAQFRRPASYIENTDNFVRRFFVGGNIRFLLTKAATLKIEGIMFLRGEVDDNRKTNYFKMTFESGFGLRSFIPSASQTVTMSFERGNKPPFATPNVNSFQVGIRFRWRGWFGE